MNQKGLVQIVILLIILAGVGVGLYLIKHPQIFRSRATFTTTAQFIDSSGRVITETRDPNRTVSLRITREMAIAAANLPASSATSSTAPSPSSSPTSSGPSYGVSIYCNGAGSGSCDFISSDANVCASYNGSNCNSSLPCKNSGLTRSGTVTGCTAAPLTAFGPGRRTYFERLLQLGDNPDSDGDLDPDSTDCATNDRRAFHGQTQYFNTARIGAGGYDFDCDGVETKRFGITTFQTTGCFAGPQSGSKGYVDRVPECGQTATYRLCGAFTTSSCGGKSCAIADLGCPESPQCEDAWNTPIANNGVAGTDTAKGWSISDKVPGENGVPGLSQPCK